MGRHSARAPTLFASATLQNCKTEGGKQQEVSDMSKVTTFNGRVVEDPPIAKFLFSDARAAWIWLPIRLWLGYQWIEAGLHKVTDPRWVQTGEALKGFWMNAVKVPEQGRPPIAFDWYRDFINGLLQSNSHTWFGPLVAWGELLIGIALVIGAFVGVAAFFGMFMNWNFIMAGAASTNGLLLVAAFLLVLAWKVAGYVGADYFLLRWLGVPWKTRDNASVTPPKASPQVGPA
jgi:thiosulfate dehydrogenase [quinone] large subunit